jgi:hypothetical protein
LGDRIQLQRRLETSPTGRALITGAIVFTLAAMVVSNLPPSELRRTGMRVVEPYLDITGLHQNWNLFAPDPRRATLQLEARMLYVDGSTAVWHPPVGDPFIGVYASFRWRKWAGNVMSSSNRGLLAPAADFVARTHPRDGRLPVQVQLFKRSYVAPMPGLGRPAVQPWNDTLLYTARYGGSS